MLIVMDTFSLGYSNLHTSKQDKTAVIITVSVFPDEELQVQGDRDHLATWFSSIMLKMLYLVLIKSVRDL